MEWLSEISFSDSALGWDHHPCLEYAACFLENYSFTVVYHTSSPLRRYNPSQEQTTGSLKLPYNNHQAHQL